MRQIALDFGPAPAPTFGNYLPGRNLAAVAALRELAAGRSEHRSVYLWGPAGVGRSHLLHALEAALPPGTARWLDTAAGARAFEFDAGVHAYLIDDVDRLGATAQEAAFHLLNRIAAVPSACWVASGAAPPRGLELREDLRTRIGAALVFELLPLDDAGKARALADAFEARGLSVGAGVVEFLLARLPRDLGTLGAAVQALDRLSLEKKRAVTVALLREFMKISDSEP
ncbi:MAG: DnaA regulatory inactivator Hda [Burkholderiales bacterium]|nr:MAG: DnaA regulatory inactivator Hda [Burkholderiales bacterium]